MRSLLLGSVSVAVSRFGQCQVAVVRPRAHGTVRRGVLVGTDGTAKSLPTVEVAYRQASMRGLPLTVAHCAWDFEAASVDWTIVRDEPGSTELRLTVAETLAGMEEKFPDVQVEVVIARGRADSFLVDQGATMDLVVVGRHDRSVLDRWGLGSVATSVIEGARSVVLVVP
jgi:nucleotide-binding universal stress UspA family protein